MSVPLGHDSRYCAMKYFSPLLRSVSVITPCLATLALAAGCSSDGRQFGSNGGSTSSGGSGHVNPTGGSGANGGSSSVDPGKGGTGSGGTGTLPSGGQDSGSAGSGGTSSGGMHSGGSSGGKGGSAGAPATGGGSSTGDACSVTTMPTGGTTVTSSNKTGKAAGLDWSLWTNSSPGSITTYDVPAFSAAWNNSGDFLARLGLQWNATKTYDAYGTISAE